MAYNQHGYAMNVHFGQADPTITGNVAMRTSRQAPELQLYL
jgi:hypothetical protein